MIPGDGLRRPVNAPRGQGTPVGVQPGVTNGVEFARQVIVFGPAGTPVGVFVYAPGTTPGPGNVPVASMTAGTKDPYGNTVIPQVFTRNGSGSIALDGNTAIFTAAGTPGSGGTIVQISNGLMSFSSGTASGGDTAATLELISAASNFEGVPILVAGGPVLAQVSGAPEFWHSVTPPTGLTGTVRYRLMPDGDVVVQVQCAVANTVAAGTLGFGTLPAGYAPLVDTRGPVGCFPNGPTTIAQLTAIAGQRWDITAGGVVQVLAFAGGAAGGVTELDFVARASTIG